MLLITFLLCPTLVSFGETDQRFLDAQSTVRDPRNWQLPVAVTIPANAFPSPSAKGGAAHPRVGVNLQVKCIHFTARRPELGCYLLLHPR